MRVLFWSLGFLPDIGGIEALAARFLPAMQARGHEFIVVTSRSHPRLPAKTTYSGIPVHRFPFWHSLMSIDHLVELKRQLHQLKRVFAPDLIHINDVGRDNFFHLTTANAHSAPLLVTLHGERGVAANPMVERMLLKADWVVGCSKAILEIGRELAPDILSRSGVIHNGLEAPPLLPAPLPFERPRLLCLGRLAVEKGFDIAIKALRILRQNFPKLAC